MTRRDTKVFLDNLITENVQTKTPKTGIGLYVSAGRKRKVLVNPRGELTPAGKYYYEKTNQEPPKSFDFAQIPQRKGRSLTINLLDGSKKVVSRFDNVAKEFKITAVGKKITQIKRIGSQYYFQYLWTLQELMAVYTPGKTIRHRQRLILEKSKFLLLYLIKNNLIK